MISFLSSWWTMSPTTGGRDNREEKTPAEAAPGSSVVFFLVLSYWQPKKIMKRDMISVILMHRCKSTMHDSLPSGMRNHAF